MEQLLKFFRSLTLRQRFTLAAAAIFVVCGLLSFLHWNRERDFKPLYTSLSAEDSGAVLAKLRENGVEYRVRDSDSTILVPSVKIAELRLQMATAGIPKSGRIGYELFDKTNLGITDFTEQVNFHRAVEGELERSVMSMAEVEQARVHISFPKDSLFTDDRQPAKASVMVKLRLGAKLSEQNTQAIAQLASSAVEGLAPEAVSVMDMRGNLLIRARKPGDGSEPSDELLQYKDKLERETLAKINSELDPLLGSEKYRAGVYIDCDLTSGEQSEESFDPTHSVITSSARSEEGSLTGGSSSSSGVPGTQSNLPRPPVKPPGQSGGLARRTENMSYETSRTVRRLKLPPGIVRRMSISVLLDQNVRWEMVGKGSSAHPQRFIDPPSPERVKAIEAIVSAAAGVNSTRGDQLIVETLPFESTLNAEPPTNLAPVTGAKKPAPAQKFSPVVLGSAAVAVVLLALVAFLFMRGRNSTSAQLAEMQAKLRAAETASVARAAEAEKQPGDDAKNREDATMKLRERSESFQLAPPLTTKSEILTKHISAEASKDPAALAKIVRSWLNEPST